MKYNSTFHRLLPPLKVITIISKVEDDRKQKVVLTTANDEHVDYDLDHVILACHSEAACKFYESAEKERILNHNEAVLLCDIQMKRFALFGLLSLS